jgi:hypothetical protein
MNGKHNLMYMRIQNKYLRNRHFRIKNWKRIRNTEHPFETYCPYQYVFGEYRIYPHNVYDAQVKRHFERIDIKAWALESGAGVFYNSPAGFRRILNKSRKAAVQNAMAKIRQGDYEVEMPHFKKDVNWLYF